jgi:hypothetical protein
MTVVLLEFFKGLKKITLIVSVTYVKILIFSSIPDERLRKCAFPDRQGYGNHWKDQGYSLQFLSILIGVLTP